MEIIRSKSNQRIKAAKKLQQKKYRTKSYLIEGWHLVEEAIKAEVPIESIFIDEAYGDRLTDHPGRVLVSSDVIQYLADTPSPQGVIAQLSLQSAPLPQELGGRYLVLDDVQDPGNVGTLIRTADAAGFQGVFLTEKTADLYNLKTLRSMQGSHFHLPIYRMDKEELLAYLDQQDLPLYVSTLARDSVAYNELSLPQSFVWVVGNEGAGVSQEMVEAANQLVHIPMPGRAESLNVAVAGGILLFYGLKNR